MLKCVADFLRHPGGNAVPEVPQFVASGKQGESGTKTERSFFCDSVVEELRKVDVRGYRYRAEFLCDIPTVPKGFHIPTPVGNYSPDWAIAFYEGTVKHIYFVAETKGTMESLNLRPIEQAKISCAKKLFNELSNSQVRYHDVDSYQNLLNIMKSIR